MSVGGAKAIGTVYKGPISVTNEDGSKIYPDVGLVDDSNSTATPLSADAVFTGTSTEILQDAIIFINVYSDVVSATDGLKIEQSSDGTNRDHDDVYTVPADTGKNYAFNPYAKYCRVIYTNGAADQTEFRLQTIFKAVNSKSSSHRIKDNIVGEDDAELVKAIVSGEGNDGIYRNAKVSSGGYIIPEDFYLAIAKGDIIGYDSVFKFGSGEITTAETVIRDGGDGYGGFLTSAVQLDITSTSVNDVNVTGTGAWVMVVYGLDTNFSEITEVVALNGTTIVTTTNSFIRVFRALILTGGSAATGAVDASNDGTIYLTKTGLSPVTITNRMAQIQPKKGQTLMCIYTVPAGLTLYITGVAGSVGSGKQATLSYKFRNGTTPNSAFSTKYDLRLYQTAIQQSLKTPLVIPEKTDIVISGTGDGTLDASASFGGVLVENTTQSTTLVNGLISYWKSDTNGSYPDALSTYNGTINGATFTGSGKINSAYSYITNDTISFGDVEFSNTAMSIGMWVNTTQTTADRMLMSKYNTGTASRAWQIALNDNEGGSGSIGFYITSDGVSALDKAATDSATINDGSWHYLTCVQYGDGVTRVDIYIDGVLQTVTRTGAAQATIDSNTANVILGNRDGASLYYDGTIDEPAVWNKALTQAEVTELYNSGAGNQYPFT